MNTYELIL